MKYLISFFLILFGIYIPNVSSQDLDEIYRKENQEREVKKQKERQKCKLLEDKFYQSNYANISQRYNLSGKTDTFAEFRYYGWQNNGAPRIYIEPNSNKLFKMRDNRNLNFYQGCGIYITSLDSNEIPFGTLNKKTKLRVCNSNKNGKKPYELEIEVFKEDIFDSNYRKEKEFLVRYHKVGDCNGNWSEVYVTIVGTIR